MVPDVGAVDGDVVDVGVAAKDVSNGQVDGEAVELEEVRRRFEAFRIANREGAHADFPA